MSMNFIYRSKVLITARRRSAIPKAMVSVNDFTEPFRKSFMLATFRKKLYNNLEQLQKDLDDWMHYYNNERPHSGRYCYGKTPMQTFNESITLAKQKLLNQVSSAA